MYEDDNLCNPIPSFQNIFGNPNEEQTDFVARYENTFLGNPSTFNLHDLQCCEGNSYAVENVLNIPPISQLPNIFTNGYQPQAQCCRNCNDNLVHEDQAQCCEGNSYAVENVLNIPPISQLPNIFSDGNQPQAQCCMNCNHDLVQEDQANQVHLNVFEQIIRQLNENRSESPSMPSTLGGIWNIKSRISQGSFGEIFEVSDMHGREAVAKLPVDHEASQTIEKEIDVYRLIDRLNWFPKMLHSGDHRGLKFIVIQRLALDMKGVVGLLNFFSRNGVGSSISGRTVLLVMAELISRLKDLHSVGVLHRDIKPKNLMIGARGTPSMNHIFLVDFGLSARYIRNGRHVPESNCGIVGTIMYCSSNLHRGICPSRRDDLESALYSIVDIYHGTLPWSKFGSIDDIASAKDSIGPGLLFQGMPVELKEIYRCVRRLRFEEIPPYEHFLEIIHSGLQRRGFDLSRKFEWSWWSMNQHA